MDIPNYVFIDEDDIDISTEAGKEKEVRRRRMEGKMGDIEIDINFESNMIFDMDDLFKTSRDNVRKYGNWLIVVKMIKILNKS